VHCAYHTPRSASRRRAAALVWELQMLSHARSFFCQRKVRACFVMGLHWSSPLLHLFVMNSCALYGNVF